MRPLRLPTKTFIMLIIEGDLREEEAVLLLLPLVLSMGLVTIWGHPYPLQVCVICQGNSHEILRYGWGLSPDHGENRQWDTFILPLSYQASPQETLNSY